MWRHLTPYILPWQVIVNVILISHSMVVMEFASQELSYCLWTRLGSSVTSIIEPCLNGHFLHQKKKGKSKVIEIQPGLLVVVCKYLQQITIYFVQNDHQLETKIVSLMYLMYLSFTITANIYCCCREANERTSVRESQEENLKLGERSEFPLLSCMSDTAKPCCTVSVEHGKNNIEIGCCYSLGWYVTEHYQTYNILYSPLTSYDYMWVLIIYGPII